MSPSILLELGYLSNREDERLLNSQGWQNKVAGALTKAIGSYFATQLASGKLNDALCIVTICANLVLITGL